MKSSPEDCSFLRMEPGRLEVPEPGAECARAVGCGIWQAGSSCEREGQVGWGPWQTWLLPTPTLRFPSFLKLGFLICKMGVMKMLLPHRV